MSAEAIEFDEDVAVEPVNQNFLSSLMGVSSNRIYMWHQRRDTTGFPEAVACTLRPQHPGDKKGSPLFDLDAVLDWWSGYDPDQRRGSHWAKKRVRKALRDEAVKVLEERDKPDPHTAHRIPRRTPQNLAIKHIEVTFVRHPWLADSVAGALPRAIRDSVVSG